jgi:uncharacterized protein (TIGR00661 family)
MKPKPLRILVCPLDWGLGHASRCIPIITHLVEAGHTVVIGGYGRSLILLQKEFPLLQSIELKGFSPSYSHSDILVLRLLLLLPQFLKTIISEHQHLTKAIKLYNFDCIISDNRYGLWNKKISCILITHQVMIKTPGWLKFAEYFIYRVSRFLISRFDECWIPDYKESPGLSGDLSHKYPLPGNARFIGPLSRFQIPESSVIENSVKREIVAIISGPEPQRGIFEDLTIKQLKELNLPATLLSGKPESAETPESGTMLTVLPHLNTIDLQSLLYSSKLVICRSGYSSIMDLHALGCEALFVPTPGQTEQLYLAYLHEHNGNALWKPQDKVSLETDIPAALKCRGFSVGMVNMGLNEAIAGLKKK